MLDAARMLLVPNGFAISFGLVAHFRGLSPHPRVLEVLKAATTSTATSCSRVRGARTPFRGAQRALETRKTPFSIGEALLNSSHANTVATRAVSR